MPVYTVQCAHVHLLAVLEIDLPLRWQNYFPDLNIHQATKNFTFNIFHFILWLVRCTFSAWRKGISWEILYYYDFVLCTSLTHSHQLLVLEWHRMNGNLYSLAYIVCMLRSIHAFLFFLLFLVRFVLQSFV